MKPGSTVFLLLAFVAATSICFPSCHDVIEDPSSTSVYFIDNQTSHELTYEVTEPVINIAIGEVTEIFSVEAFGRSGITSDIVFEYFEQDPGEVYLFRDSSGVTIEALKLNPATNLVWDETPAEQIQASNIFHYTLIVTDDMIN